MNFGRKLRLALCLILGGFLSFAASTVAQDIEATWMNQEKDAHIEIKRCGDNLCGAIVWLKDPLDERGQPEVDDENPNPDLHQRPVLGLKILEGFDPQPNRDGLWTGGTIYDPNNGKTYRCQMSFKKTDTLKIRGYIGISLLGRTAIWTRVSPQEAQAARDAMAKKLPPGMITNP